MREETGLLFLPLALSSSSSIVVMMSGADSTTGPGADSRLLPLLETLQDPAASPGALTDALLTLVK